MTTTDIMIRLCTSHRTLHPTDHTLWYVWATPSQMDVIRVSPGLVGPWFEVIR